MPPRRPSPSLPLARGPLSAALLERLTGRTLSSMPNIEIDDPLGDDDLHLALYLGYELHYRGFEGVEDALEWDRTVLALRATMERAFESALRDCGPGRADRSRRRSR